MTVRTLPRFNDMHVHLRVEPMLSEVLRWTASLCDHALIMPNLAEPVTNAARLMLYRDMIMAAVSTLPVGKLFRPLMTIYLTDDTTPQMIEEARAAGAVAAKLYFRGTTTNAHHGVTDLWRLRPVFAEMSKQGMVLCIHGEKAVGCVTDWEAEFLPDLVRLANDFPDLRIVMEHVTTSAAVSCIKMLDNVAATITAHHQLLTLNDVIGFGQIKPLNFCMPVAKKEPDRAALVEIATSAHPRFFFGSDSAPHLKGNKLCACGAAGVFSAPVLASVLADVFEKAGALDALSAFTSANARFWYGLPSSSGSIDIVREPYVVPAEIGGVVPFLAGQTLPWRVIGDH